MQTLIIMQTKQSKQDAVKLQIGKNDQSIQLDQRQINKLNAMFGKIDSYDSNMQALWKLRSFLYNQLEEREWPESELKAMFHTINTLIGSLLPTNDIYHPSTGYVR